MGDLADNVHHIWETATATAALAQRMIDLGGDDDRPRVGAEELADDPLDLAARDHIAVADQHDAKGRFQILLSMPDIAAPRRGKGKGGIAVNLLRPGPMP